jgi:hypothetical protein
MTPPPSELDGARVICFAKISDAVVPTGKTRHLKAGKVLGAAAGLAVCQYPGDNYFYLFYCDPNWAVLTDTWHMTLGEAKDQALFEYEGIDEHWEWA